MRRQNNKETRGKSRNKGIVRDYGVRFNSELSCLLSERPWVRIPPGTPKGKAAECGFFFCPRDSNKGGRRSQSQTSGGRLGSPWARSAKRDAKAHGSAPKKSLFLSKRSNHPAGWLFFVINILHDIFNIAV